MTGTASRRPILPNSRRLLRRGQKVHSLLLGAAYQAETLVIGGKGGIKFYVFELGASGSAKLK